MRLAVGRVLLLAAMLPLLAGCDPYPPGEPGTADVDVQLKADGDAEIMIFLPADRNGLSLLKLGGQVGEALFPQARTRRASLDDQGGVGYPLVRVKVTAAYSPGSHPRLTFDIGGTVRALSDEGLTSVQVSIGAPAVPATARWSVPPDDQSDRYWFWNALRPTQPTPLGEVFLDPRPSRAVAALLLLTVTVGSLAAGFFAARARRRWTGVVLGTTAFGTSLLNIAGGGAIQGNNLGVAGYLSGTTLQVVTLLPVAALLGFPLGITVVVMAFSRPTATTGPIGT